MRSRPRKDKEKARVKRKNPDRYDTCDSIGPICIGCDFGAPRKAGDQAKKIIAIEAVEVGAKHFAIQDLGHNRRLLEPPNGRPGWTVPALRDALVNDRSVLIGAFDFPFSIPLSLLHSAAFALKMDVHEPFQNRREWAAVVASRLRLEFTREGPCGEMSDLTNFDAWRDSSFWHRRACDIATKACPPLKHVGQNLFSMTLAGTALLENIKNAGYEILLGQLPSATRRVLFETYPSLVARRVGFQGSYKKEPGRCIETALLYLARQGIRLDFAPEIRSFCESYRTGGSQRDPDGSDAFLCLVAAICYRAGVAEVVYGDATPSQREEEGGIVAPLPILSGKRRGVEER